MNKDTLGFRDESEMDLDRASQEHNTSIRDGLLQRATVNGLLTIATVLDELNDTLMQLMDVVNEGKS